MVIKRIALICLLAIWLGLALHETLLQSALELYLSHYAKKAGYNFSYEKVLKAKNSLTFFSPQISLGKENPLSAETLEITYAFHPFSRSLDIDIALRQPLLSLESKEIDLLPLLSQFSPASSWIQVHGHFLCEKGQLTSDEKRNWAFSIDHTWQEELTQAHCQIYCPEDPMGKCLTLSLGKNKGYFNATGIGSDLLNQFLKSFAGFEAPKIEKGVLNGSLAFEIEDGQLKKTQGILILNDLSLRDSKGFIKANFEEFHIKGSKNSSGLMADFVKGDLHFSDQNGLYSSLKDLQGEMSFEAGNLKLGCQGIWSFFEEVSEISLDASTHFLDFQNSFLKLNLAHPNLSQRSGLEVSSEPITGDASSIGIQFYNIGEKEFGFVQKFLDALIPELNPFQYLSGSLSANLALIYGKRGLASLEVEDLKASDLSIFFKPWRVALGFQNLEGSFGFDLTAKIPKDTIDASLVVHGGEIAIKGAADSPWNFTEIETRLEVVKGTLQDSSASVKLDGLKGKAEIIGGRTAHLMRLSFQGEASELIPFVPERIKKGIEKSLKNDLVNLQAEVTRQGDGVEVAATLAIKTETSLTLSPIDFGFTIERIFPNLFSSNIDAQENYLASLTPAIQTSLMPDRDLLLSCLMQHHLRQEIGYSGFKLDKGWIQANHLLLGKLIGPFLFPEEELTLSGYASVEGIFDSTGFYIGYKAKEVVLENEQLSIQVKEIASSPDEQESFYAADFNGNSCFGFIPIHEASYFDKNSGLLFAEMQGDLFFETEKLHIENLSAFSNGIYFEGDIVVDYSIPLKGSCDVDIHAAVMEGNFRQAQHLLAHFEKTLCISKIPVNGILNFGSEGGFLHFGIRPAEVEFQARFDCSLEDGTLFSENGHFSLQELSCGFIYDYNGNFLDLSNLQSMVVIGKNEQIDEFSLHADRIYFDDFANNHAFFDIWIKDDKSDFIRLAGSTRAENPLQPEKVEFFFDKDLSHFGDIYPQVFSLTLTDWNRVDKLEFEANLSLTTLLNDLQKMKWPLSFIFEKPIDGINQLSPRGGELSLKVGFEGNQGTFGFDVAGKDLIFNQYEIKEFQFSGYKRDERWLIEQIQLDQISIAAEIMNKGKHWQVDFLGFRYGDALLVGLDGSYQGGDTPVQAHVNLFEIDMSKLPRWNWLTEALGEHQIAGKFKGIGEIALQKKDRAVFEGEIHLDVSAKDFKIEDYLFENAEHFSFHFSTAKGWSLNNLVTGLMAKSPQGIHLEAKEIGYDFDAETWRLEDISFSIPQEGLHFIASQLESYFPLILDRNLLEDIRHFSESSVKGNFTIKKSISDCRWELTLEDGLYRLFGEKRELKKITLQYSEEELALSVLYILNQQPIWISTRFSEAEVGHGKVILADADPAEFEKPALSVLWRKEEERGLIIEKASGYFAGLRVDLKENVENPTTAEAFHLIGVVDVDGSLARHLLPPMFSEAIQTFQIGKGYQIQGAFEVGKETKEDEERETRFFGTLSGNQVELKGYRFDRMAAEIILDANSVQLLDFTISDLAGVFYIGNLRADKSRAGFWHLSIPLLTAYEVRPSLFREAIILNPRVRKPLIVRQFFIQDLTGILGDVKTFKGHGSLSFINPQKKNLQNTIFAIPAEILTRIGLNLSVLTPVTGTIHFEVQGDQFLLTKFKDVYSDNKISKFYLATSRGPSTVDFDGNIDVQVRFKQSTLLLKIAEMFTINIHGNLNKPLYSLQRQKYLMNQEVFASSDQKEEGEKNSP